MYSRNNFPRAMMSGLLIMAVTFGPLTAMAKKNEDSTKDRLDALETDVSGLTSDVGGLQNDVSGLTTDTGALQSDVSGLSSDVGTLQSDVGSLQTDSSNLQAAITTLQSDLAAASALNTAQAAQISALTTTNSGQATQIMTLARKIRLGARQEQFERQKLVVIERLNTLKRLQWLADQGQMPPTLPGLMLVNEINFVLDIAEKIRCGVSGLDRTEYDCIASDGEVIEEDEYVVPESSIVVLEEVPIIIEYGVEEPVLTLEQAIEASQSAECLLYKDDLDNDFKLALCTATLGIETSELLVEAAAMSIATNMASNTFIQGIECEDLELTELELESCESGWDAVGGAWVGLTVEGEESIDVPENCVASNFDPLTGTTPGCP